MVVGTDQQEEGKERDIKKEGVMGGEVEGWGGSGGREGGKEQEQAKERGL